METGVGRTSSLSLSDDTARWLLALKDDAPDVTWFTEKISKSDLAQAPRYVQIWKLIRSS